MHTKIKIVLGEQDKEEVYYFDKPLLFNYHIQDKKVNISSKDGSGVPTVKEEELYDSIFNAAVLSY